MFGGLVDRQLFLPDEPFVVIMGGNEAGKSSIATLMAWLLVGAHGDAGSVLRFGDPEMTLAGQLEGMFGHVVLTSDGKFKLTKQGVSQAKSSWTLNLDGGEVPVEAWRQSNLRGIDDAVLQAIYLMSGADLHSGAKVHAAISSLAAGGMAGASRANDLVAELAEESRKWLKARANDSTSFAKFTSELNDAVGRRRKLIGDPAEYKSMVDKVEELQTRLAGIQPRRDEINAELVAIGVVRAALSDARSMSLVDDELAGLPIVEPTWESVATNLLTVNARLDAVEGAETELLEARKTFEEACRAVSLSNDEGRLIKVGASEAIEINTLLHAADVARDAFDDAQRNADDARRAVENAHKELDVARAACPDLDDDALRAVRADDAARDQVLEAITRLGGDENEEAKAHEGLRVAQGELDLAGAALERARNAWSGFRSDVTAEQWLAQPSLRAAAPAGSQSPMVVRAIFAAAALVTGISILVLDRPIALGVAVVAFVGAFVMARATRRLVVEGSDEPVVRAAADNVVAALRLVEAAEGKMKAAQAAAAGRTSDVEQTRTNVLGLAAGLGYSLMGDAASQRSRAEAVTAAARAMRSVDAAEGERTESDGMVASAESKAANAEAALRMTLREYGIPERIPHRGAADEIAKFQTVAALAGALSSAEADLAGMRRALAQATAPIEADVLAMNMDEIRDRLNKTAGLVAHRNELMKKRTEFETRVENHLSGNKRARELKDDDPDDSDLDLWCDTLQGELPSLESAYQDLSQQIATLQAEIKTAEAKETLAALQLEIGELEESRDAALIEGVAALFAAQVLAEVTEEVRQKNQPALVQQASAMAKRVAADWDQLRIEQSGPSELDVRVRRTDGKEVGVSKLSTGAQGLLYLALRLAAAEQDAEVRRDGLRFPLLCDDPLVHFDDQRATAAAELLADVASRGHQVMLFTCNSRTEQLAKAAGAVVVPFG